MSDLYKKAKTGRLTYKGGEVATLESKKKKKKRKHKTNDAAAPAADNDSDIAAGGEPDDSTAAEATEDVYTIDAAKKMKYEEIFPVEAKKFGYDPVNKSHPAAAAAAASKSVEDALDDRVKKKADRYCK